MSVNALSAQGVTIAIALGSPSDFTGGTIPNVVSIQGPGGSATVIDAKVAVIWKVRPTPRRQIARGFRPTSSWPSNTIDPWSA